MKWGISDIDFVSLVLNDLNRNVIFHPYDSLTTKGCKPEDWCHLVSLCQRGSTLRMA